MPLARLHAAFDHPDWLFELKYDGFRALAYVEAGAVRLVSRRGNVYKSFRDLCTGLAAALPVEAAVLNGEIVHLDTDGKPQFYDLLRRRTPQQFVAFDLLWLDGRDLRSLPLVERKRQLRAIVPARSSALLYCDHIATRGVELFERVCGLDLEGIVAKRKDGLYTPEETSWVKIKNPAYSEVEGRGELFEKGVRAASV
jgi:bifunctional non-homologous end joining protein LigD